VAITTRSGVLTRSEADRAALIGRLSQRADAEWLAELLIEQAEPTLEEASGVIANGYLRLDPQEWIRAVEKRQAALGR
jgi:hypothetical protein